MAQERTRPSEAVVRRLFARSGNRCAFPRCGTEIVQGDTTIGQVCHIRSDKPGGPRFDPQQSATERHGYKNLILLCANHHKVVDDDTEAYTPARLVKMKSDRERRTEALSEEVVERGTRLLVDQSVASENQSGGITASMVVVHLAPPAPPATPPSLIPKLLDWHSTRAQQVWTRATPVKLLDDGEALLMHVLPISALDDRPSQAFEAISRSPRLFPPIKGEGFFQPSIRFDGLLNEADGQGLGDNRRA
jgi:hypothetical protein